LLPSVILSGFVFPIESMPWIIQIITNLTPAKFFMVILRGIILKGAGIWSMWDQIIYLIIFILFFLGLASIVSKKKERTA
ncbi:ABC transporter permease, partial [Bacteroidota bacterium]